MTPEHVAEQLAQVGTCLRDPAELNARLSVDASTWTRFAAQWDDLAPDRYAAELGTRRLRRYGYFLFSSADGVVTPMATAHSYSRRTPTRSTSSRTGISSR